MNCLITNTINNWLYYKIGEFNHHKAIAMLYTHPYARRYCRVVEREGYRALEFLPDVLIGVPKHNIRTRLHWNANLMTTIFIELVIPNPNSKTNFPRTKQEMYVHFDVGCLRLCSLEDDDSRYFND